MEHSLLEKYHTLCPLHRDQTQWETLFPCKLVIMAGWSIAWWVSLASAQPHKKIKGYANIPLRGTISNLYAWATSYSATRQRSSNTVKTEFKGLCRAPATKGKTIKPAEVYRFHSRNTVTIMNKKVFTMISHLHRHTQKKKNHNSVLHYITRSLMNAHHDQPLLCKYKGMGMDNEIPIWLWE